MRRWRFGRGCGRGSPAAAARRRASSQGLPPSSALLSWARSSLAQRTHSGMNRARRTVEPGSNRESSSEGVRRASIGLHELWKRAQPGACRVRLLVLHQPRVRRRVLRAGRSGRARGQQGGRPVPPAPAPGPARAPGSPLDLPTETTHSGRSAWRADSRRSVRGRIAPRAGSPGWRRSSTPRSRTNQTPCGAGSSSTITTRSYAGSTSATGGRRSAESETRSMSSSEPSSASPYTTWSTAVTT